MKTLDLEHKIKDGGTVRLQTLPSGEVEVVLSELKKPQFGYNGNLENSGGVCDKSLAIIPKSKFMECAEFFAQLHNKK